jgi:hypothetical protein
VAFVAAALAAPLGAAPSPDLHEMVTGDPPGVRQTEKLADKADRLIDAVESTQSQVRATLAAYDGLIYGSSADLRKPYKALARDMDKCDRLRETAQRRADEARAESTDYYRAWAGSLPLIEDNDLRARSEARLRASRSRFEQIVEAGRRAADAYAPFLGRLRDQWNYLGHDLNPSGLESLRPDARALADEGGRLLLEIDESLRQAREFVASIRSRQPPPPEPEAPAEPEAPSTPAP